TAKERPAQDRIGDGNVNHQPSDIDQCRHEWRRCSGRDPFSTNGSIEPISDPKVIIAISAPSSTAGPLSSWRPSLVSFSVAHCRNGQSAAGTVTSEGCAALHPSGSRRDTTQRPFALPTRGAGMPPV